MPRRHDRALIAGGYAVALLLVLVPLGEMTLYVLPLRLADPAWRFGAVGYFSNALLTPLLGLALAGALALVLRQRRIVRTIAVVLLAAAALLTGSMVVFVLDALEMRASVVPDAKTAFDVASAQALAKIVLVTIVSFVLGVGGWRSPRHRRERRHTTRSRKARLVRAPRDAAAEEMEAEAAHGSAL
jgi:hypothetical protein